MKSILQLLRRPWKTVFGIFLTLLACLIICICFGQYIASVQTQKYVEDNYTTVGLLTSRFMTEDIMDGEGNVIGTASLSEQPWDVQEFLTEVSSMKDSPYIKGVQQNLLTSGYLADINPFGEFDHVLPALSGLQDDATNTVDKYPYTYAMFAVRVDEIGRIRSFYDYVPAFPVDTDACGYAIDLTGVILEVGFLHPGYADPVEHTIHITVRFASEEEAAALELQTGCTYLVCGKDYEDRDASLRQSYGEELEDILNGPADVRWLTEEEIALLPPPFAYAVASYHIEGEDRDHYLNESEAGRINSSALTVCANPLLYEGKVNEKSISLQSGASLSAEEYISLYRDSGIVRLDGSVQSFLDGTEDPFWKKWLETAEINNHSFPVLGVEDLDAVAQFAIQDAVLTEGRGFLQSEIDSGARLCIISESLAAANQLSVSDKISIRFYETDPDLVDNKRIPKQANPYASYYSQAAGFSGDAEEYEIIGLYRQNNEWAMGTYCFTPNTVFVPKAVILGGTDICGGIYTSVVLQNGTAGQLEQLAAEHGFEGLFIIYDQGYTQIMDSLQDYYRIGYVVLFTGSALWGGIALLYLFLFPCQLLTDLKRMWSLGASPSKMRRHVIVSSAGILLPGTALGCIMAALLFDKMIQYIAAAARADLALKITAGELGGIAAAQMLVILLMSWCLAGIFTIKLKRNRRK